VSTRHGRGFEPALGSKEIVVRRGVTKKVSFCEQEESPTQSGKKECGGYPAT